MGAVEQTEVAFDTAAEAADTAVAGTAAEALVVDTADTPVADTAAVEIVAAAETEAPLGEGLNTGAASADELVQQPS